MSFNEIFIYCFFLPLFLFYFLQLTSMVCFEHRQVDLKITEPRKECKHRPNGAVDTLVQAVTISLFFVSMFFKKKNLEQGSYF